MSLVLLFLDKADDEKVSYLPKASRSVSNHGRAPSVTRARSKIPTIVAQNSAVSVILILKKILLPYKSWTFFFFILRLMRQKCQLRKIQRQVRHRHGEIGVV